MAESASTCRQADRINLDDLRAALDRPLKRLTCPHLLLFPLLACCWLFSTNGFVDIFTMQPVNLDDCYCDSHALPLASDLCQACNGTVRCPPSNGSWTTASRAWGLYCANDWQRSLPSEATQVGVAVGELVVGPVADRFGRRRAVVSFAALAAVSYAASAAAPDLAVYSLAKAVLGAATAATSISGFTLATELAGPSLRTLLTVELWSYAWTTMSCVLPLVALSLSRMSWRTLVFAVAAPYALFACVLAAAVPESPLWLYRHGDSQRLARVLHHLLGDRSGQRLLTGSNGAPAPPAATQHVAASEQPPPLPGGAHADEPPADNSPAAATRSSSEADEDAPTGDLGRRGMLRGCLGGFGALFHDAARARITLAESYLWAACALSYYGISFNSAEVSSRSRPRTPHRSSHHPLPVRAKRRRCSLPVPVSARAALGKRIHQLCAGLVAALSRRLRRLTANGRAVPRSERRLDTIFHVPRARARHRRAAASVRHRRVDGGQLLCARRVQPRVRAGCGAVSHFGALDGDRLPLSRLQARHFGRHRPADARRPSHDARSHRGGGRVRAPLRGARARDARRFAHGRLDSGRRAAACGVRSAGMLCQVGVD